MNGSVDVTLRWPASPDEGIEGWQGYELYQGLHSLLEVPPESLAAYRVSAQPQTGRDARITGLLRGVRYYFAVRSIRHWSDQEQRSALDRQIDTAPFSYHIARMVELASPSGGAQAIDFSLGGERPLDPADPSGVANRDLYVGSSDTLDGPGTLCLKSVSLLGNRNAAWEARRVKIKFIGTDWSANGTSDSGWGEKAEMVEGGVYAVLLPEGNYAKVQVVPGGISGSYPNRIVQLQCAYQPIANYPRF